MELLGYIGAALIGLSLGLFGGGGAILAVPLFVYFFKVPPFLATSYSLFIVGVSSAFGFYRAVQKKQMDWRSGWAFALPSLLGVFLIRHGVMPLIPMSWQWGALTLDKDSVVLVSFSVIMVLAAGSMIFSKSSTQSARSSILQFALKAFIVGGVTGFVGAGGGFLIVPALTFFAGLSMPVAVGTSLGVIALNSLLGFGGDLFKGVDLQWGLLAAVTAIALLGLVLGTKLAPMISEKKLKPLFGYFVLVLGGVILILR